MSVKLERTENNINIGDFENVFCRTFVPWDVILLGWEGGSRICERTYHLHTQASRSMSISFAKISLHEVICKISDGAMEPQSTKCS